MLFAGDSNESAEQLLAKVRDAAITSFNQKNLAFAVPAIAALLVRLSRDARETAEKHLQLSRTVGETADKTLQLSGEAREAADKNLRIQRNLIRLTVAILAISAVQLCVGAIQLFQLLR